MASQPSSVARKASVEPKKPRQTQAATDSLRMPGKLGGLYRAVQAKRLRNDGRIKSFVNPRQLLPSLHNKTHFKAVQEYLLGETAGAKSMYDADG